MGPEALRGMRMPCILHWNYNNFVVLEGFEDELVFINDPAAGRRLCSWEELDEAFTGIVLTDFPAKAKW